MNPAGIGTEQLTIEHEGKPCDGMPVGRATGCKRPANAVRGQTIQNMRIFVYIDIIIVVDKIEIADLPEYQQSTQCQNRVNRNDERFLHKFGPNSR